MRVVVSSLLFHRHWQLAQVCSPQVRREALLDATSPLLHLILLVKLSRKLPVRRLLVEGHREFNPIKTALAFPHSWYPGSN